MLRRVGLALPSPVSLLGIVLTLVYIPVSLLGNTLGPAPVTSSRFTVGQEFLLSYSRFTVGC